MKCIFPECNNEASCSKQFNDIIVRAYLCAEHLIKVSDIDPYHHGAEFIKRLYDELEKCQKKD